MNTDLLKTFIEVSKTRHFGRAADNLYVTQSAISFRIKQLETEVGASLFIRQRNNILLTAAGERFLPHAETILAAWHVAMQVVGGADKSAMSMTLGSTPLLWEAKLHSAVPPLIRKHPKLQLRTEVASTQSLANALLVGQVDMALTLTPPVHSDLTVINVCSLTLCYVSSQPNQSVADLGEGHAVIIDWGVSVNMALARTLATSVQPTLNTTQCSVALAFLLQHGGHALLPSAMLRPYMGRQLFSVDGVADIQRPLFLVVKNEWVASDAVATVMNDLTALLQATPEKDDT